MVELPSAFFTRFEVMVFGGAPRFLSHQTPRKVLLPETCVSQASLFMGSSSLVMNPCRPAHATIESVLNILVLDVRAPRWQWTSSRACVKQPKVSFHRLSNCAKVPKNSVSRLSLCISSKNCAFSPGTRDRRDALQVLHLPSVELVRDTYGPSTLFEAGLGCKIERRQILHTEARLGRNLR